MEFEVIRKCHKKSIVIGASLFIVLAIVLVVRFAFAKYELVKSIKIAEGTINYKVPDFKIMAMYKNDGNGDIEIDTMPESGYTINESKSYCTLDNVNEDTKAKLFTNEDGKHVISGLSKSSKCYLYFDKVSTAGETILGNVTVNEGTPDFSKTAQATCSDASTCETTNGVYKATDNDGDTYYFRGSVTNNYVKFGKNSAGKDMYWRIVRINGDGTIRLIYDGTNAHTNGTSTSDSIAASSQKFSHKDAYYRSWEDSKYVLNNAYVGFKYTTGILRGLGTKSNALQQLETWYTNNLSSYAAKIDINAGFCGDRTPYTNSSGTTSGGGTGTATTYYAGYIRLGTNKSPILTCADTNDLYTVSNSNKGNKSLTYPIGLITADEVAMVGGLWRENNNNYYLYTGQGYWTLTPSLYVDLSSLFVVNAGGDLNYYRVDAAYNIRPVINIRPDTKFTFTGTGEKGTMTNPYIVN